MSVKNAIEGLQNGAKELLGEHLVGIYSCPTYDDNSTNVTTLLVMNELKNASEVQEKLSPLLTDIALESGVVVSALPVKAEEFKSRKDELLRRGQARRKSEENARADGNSRVGLLMKKAQRSRFAAEALVRRKHYGLALCGAYYAALNAARGALAGKGVEHTEHAEVVKGFLFYFVKSGRLPKEVGNLLALLYEAYQESDYKLGEPDGRHIGNYVEAAAKFVDAVKLCLTTVRISAA